MILLKLSLIVVTLLGGLCLECRFSCLPKMAVMLLICSGSYLLTITFVHFLPDIFGHVDDPFWVGICLVCGFFLQHFCEILTVGITHSHDMTNHAPLKHTFRAFPFLFSIFIHAMLDGPVLMHEYIVHKSGGLSWHGAWLGMLMHKFLEAFSFVMVLKRHFDGYNWWYLLLLALATPIGLDLGHYIGSVCSDGFGRLFMAFVIGNFIHISATILFESNPEHSNQKKYLWMNLLGMGLALFMEMIHHR